MADRYGPKHVKAWHTNFPMFAAALIHLIILFTLKTVSPRLFSTWAPSLATNPFLYLQHALQPYTAREKTSLARWDHISKTGSAYQEIQDTKPQTLGYSLADSPLGLLAWIYEKLVAWTDAYKWDDDEGMTHLHADLTHLGGGVVADLRSTSQF